MTLKFYNTLTKQKEVFEPVQPGRVGIYLCGPTVYKDSHIGHAVGPVIFDALKKFLTFKGYDVKLIVNITDVDDKLIIESQQRNMSIKDLAAEVSAGYFDALTGLGVDSIDDFPRATDHIDHIIKLIQRLEANQAAYAVDNGDVYFDITKSRDYGKLSHRKSDDQITGSRELAGGAKRNAADFALWKAAAPDEIGWQSPWGYGRPGWHIECSAMSMEYLGETFDIHGGGMDLVFPHHENEIAQSETATGCCFARYWMHNGLTRIKTKAASGDWQTEKMSKSLGNVKELKALLTQYPGALIRFFLLSTHYRRPIDFSDESLAACQKGMMTIYRALERVERLTADQVYGQPADLDALRQADPALADELTALQQRYLDALDDDFNTAGAIAMLFEMSAALNRFMDQQQMETKPVPQAQAAVLQAARLLTDTAGILGLFTEALPDETADDDGLADGLMTLLIDLRAQARKDKNFAMADTIRDRLTEMNIVLEDRPNETLWRLER